MASRLPRLVACIGLLLFLFACGGSTSDSGPPSTPTTPTTPTPPATVSCHQAAAADVFGATTFVNRHPVNVKSWGCVIASSASGAPVFDGASSARFEVRPDDCTGSQSFDDCTNDRSRHEIEERTPPSQPSGAVVRYETHLYVPTQERFKPAGENLMFLTQIRFTTPTTIGNIAYLRLGSNDDLFVQTNVGAASQNNREYLVGKLPFDRWFRVDWEVKASGQSDGFIRAFVDGVLVADETRPTLPEPSGYSFLAFGIYNAFKSRATQPFATQIMYVDGIRKTIQ